MNKLMGMIRHRYIKKNEFKEYTEIDPKVKGMPNIPNEYLPDYRLINKNVIIPSDEELENNNRSRSAKLRIIERIKYGVNHEKEDYKENQKNR